jgi:hypothetical protein
VVFQHTRQVREQLKKQHKGLANSIHLQQQPATICARNRERGLEDLAVHGPQAKRYESAIE